MRLDHHPFHIGATQHPHNPQGLPDTYPFEVIYDDALKILKQLSNDDLEKVLSKAYKLGNAFGTPLAADKFGKPYADDFLNFINKQSRSPEYTGLEIGAGVGYLTRCLIDSGWQMTSLEPGVGYDKYWKKYNVDIINDFFPTNSAYGPFDMICSYGVLEHISTPIVFLDQIKQHLAEHGKVFLAVPDCSDEIMAGDPSILFHEHFNYFDSKSLAQLINQAGMSATVIKSGFGRCLYAMAWKSSEGLSSSFEASVPPESLIDYADRCQALIEVIRLKIRDLTSAGSVGIYCAARGLALLEANQAFRFFDDDPAQHGQYLPPFNIRIETRDALLSRPVNHLIIMSRTFGAKIRASLMQAGYSGNITLIEELQAS